MLVTIILTLCIVVLTTFLIKQNLKVKQRYVNYTLLPYRFPVIGHLFEYITDANKFIFENFKKYGSTFTANILGQRMTFLLDLHDLHTMNKNSQIVFAGAEMVTDAFGSRRTPKDVGEAVSEALHKTIYPKTLQHPDALKELTSRFLQNFHQKLDRDKRSSKEEWHECGLLKLCREFIFQASTRSLFGDIEDQDLKEIEENFFIFTDKHYLFYRGFPQWFYKLFYRKECQARQKVIQLLIEERNDESEFVKSLRELFQHKYNETFLPTDVGAHMLIFLFASATNVIPTIFWILYYLSMNENRQAFEEIRQEIIAQNGEMDKLKLVDSTINEVLRLMANIFLMRYTYKTDGTTLELHNGRQLHIYPKDLICYYPCILHYDENVFPQPHMFIYDRFLRLEKLPPSYIPFGNGKSICPGRFFARNEIKTVLIALVKEIDLELVESGNEKPPQFRKECVGTGVMLPDKDVKVRFRFKS